MWYTRPVLFVADTSRALKFYVEELGFREAWSHSESGTVLVAQVERDGCEIILTEQFREKIGRGMLFISLDAPRLAALALECQSKGIELQEGWWGYRCSIVADPDGNQLYFPDSDDKAGRDDE